MPPPLRCPSITSVAACAKQLQRTPLSRSFSSTAPNEQRLTRARAQMFRWLNSKGETFREPAAGKTNYLPPPVASASDDPLQEQLPFPQNRQFVSQPILSEETREEIWKRVMQDGQSVRDVSAALSIEMRRVAAVVRLKEVEKEWLRIGKPLARPYAQAVTSMLPASDHKRRQIVGNNTFESINDLTLHTATAPQIFYPTSESRHFTRNDAARVFDAELLPADDRIPHPQLTLQHKDALAGLSPEEIQARQVAREEAAEKRRQIKLAKKAQKEAEAVRAVDTERWRFRITEVNVDDAGRTGRGEKGVGWRYGAPLMDRKKGIIKIPRKVE